jgi:hypothetical protein
MTAISQLEQAALLLAETIQADWEQDLPSSAWLGAEGETVRDNALTLVQAARSGTLHDVLGGVSIHAYLGQAWLDIHSKSYEQAHAFQALASQDAA